MKSLPVITLILILCSNVFSEDKFELLAEIRIPSLMTSAQSLTTLSENIIPGTSGLIGFSVAALAFDPKLACFDLTAPIQLLGYGSKTSDPKEMQWCIVMTPKNENGPGAQISDKKRNVFVKTLGDRAVLSYSKTLADSIMEIPSMDNEKDDYDVKIIFYPKKYLDAFPDGLSSLKNEATELALKKSGRKEEDLNKLKVFSIKMDALEKAVSLFSRIESVIKFNNDSLSAVSELYPIEGSAAESFLKIQTKASAESNACDTGAGSLISYGHVNLTDQLKSEIIEKTREILIETTEDYNPEITGFYSELVKSFSGNFRYRLDSFTPESVCCLETSVSDGKYQTLKDYISGAKTIKEIKKGIYAFNPENADKDKYNSFANLNSKIARTVYGKTNMSSVEKLLEVGIPSGNESQTKADIFIYAFSNDGKNSRTPLLSTFVVYHDKSLTISTDVFRECIKMAIPPNLIPQKKNVETGTNQSK